MSHKPNPAHPIVTLTTDFGLSDAYVAAMKAAILRQSPHAVLVDVTHNVPPQDVLCGSISLERAVDGFGPGTVHLAVVDPGVGTNRRILLVEIHGSIVVCPDNGLITWTWRRLGPGRASELIWRPHRKISDTFHGRDIMGPVAGMLAGGKRPSEIARPINDPILLDVAPPSRPVESGQIIHIDHFGNGITNIPRDSLNSLGKLTARVGRKKMRLKRTYVDAAPGCALALFGSSGLLEIAVRDGSAAKALGLRVGTHVTITSPNPR
ncbi:MAG TPA: SAM-dependent chlorinase/fluorinase [Tepidisphaeraceae bacterium]|nr:SAM-dependent chlorinase/fluorinase [Tepidisphaeraceae bacterium]